METKAIRRKANIIGWGMIAPTVLSIALFIIYPLVFSLILSFTNWKFVFSNVQFVGFANYQWLFSSRGIQFWKSLLVSLEFTFISTAIQTLLGFWIAYILYNMSPRFQAVYKVLIYVPVVLPAAVISVMWTFIYTPNIGLIDRLLTGIGITNPPLWLDDPSFAMGSVIFTNTWRYLGVTVIIYFVAMNAIPRDTVESAQVEGAGKSTILWRILLPLTFSSTKVNLLLSIMGGLKSFDLFYLFTSGQPIDELYVVGMYIYNTAFKYRTFARAVTMSIILSIVIGGITLLCNTTLSKGEEHYE